MKKALIFGAAALGAAAMGRRGQRSRKIFLAMQGLPNQGRRAAHGDTRTWEMDLRDLDHVDTVSGIPIYLDRDPPAPWSIYDSDMYVVAIDPHKQSTWKYVYSIPEARKMAKGIARKMPKGRRAARPRTYKTLAGLSRAMGDRTLSLDEIHSQRAYLKGKGWSPINYRLTYADATEIAKVLGGRKDTQRDVRNGLLYGRIGDLPYSTRQRITWDKHGWGYVAGQDYRAETARIRNILKK